MNTNEAQQAQPKEPPKWHPIGSSSLTSYGEANRYRMELRDRGEIARVVPRQRKDGLFYEVQIFE